MGLFRNFQFTPMPLIPSFNEEITLKRKLVYLARDFLVFFIACFFFYFAKGIIYYGPWGSASGNPKSGLTSAVVLAFLAGLTCALVFCFSFRFNRKPYLTFMRCSCFWALVSLMWSLSRNNSATVVTNDRNAFQVYEPGGSYFFSLIYELSNPFILLAAFSIFLYLKFNRSKLSE